MCSSKISYNGRVESVLKRIFRILKEYFPTNIAYWSELNEERLEKLEESGLYKLDPNAWISKDIFYKEAEEVFSTNFLNDKGQFLEVREKLVNVLNYRASHNHIYLRSENLAFPDTPLLDPDVTRLSRPSAKISSAEQKAKTWVVEENKGKPWNMEKVLEELGEVLNDKCIVICNFIMYDLKLHICILEFFFRLELRKTLLAAVAKTKERNLKINQKENKMRLKMIILIPMKELLLD